MPYLANRTEYRKCMSRISSLLSHNGGESGRLRDTVYNINCNKAGVSSSLRVEDLRTIQLVVYVYAGLTPHLASCTEYRKYTAKTSSLASHKRWRKRWVTKTALTI